MFCPNCKNQLPDNIAFCPVCGYKIKTVPLNSEIQQPKSNKGLKIAVAVLAVVAVAAIVFAILTVTGAFNKEGSSATQTTENKVDENYVNNLSDEEQIKITIEQLLEGVLDKDVKKFMNYATKYSQIYFDLEKSEEETLDTVAGWFLGTTGIKVENIEIENIEISESPQKDLDSIEEMFIELEEQVGHSIEIPEYTLVAFVDVTYEITFPDGSTLNAKQHFEMVKENGRWVIEL